MKVLNLTQHLATPEQIAAGVVEPAIDAKKQLVSLLTFEQLPTAAEIRSRAYDIAAVARSQYVTEPTEGVRFTHAMIGGAPYLMGPLEIALRASQITPVYAFSVRESVDEVQPDGSVRKVAVFRHVGFVGLDQEIESDEPETLSEEKCARYRDLAASHLTATTAESVTALFQEMKASDDAYNFELSADGQVGRWSCEDYLQIGRTAELAAVLRDGIVYQY